GEDLRRLTEEITERDGRLAAAGEDLRRLTEEVTERDGRLALADLELRRLIGALEQRDRQLAGAVAKRVAFEERLAAEAAKRESVERDLVLRSTEAAQMAEAVAAAEGKAKTFENILASESLALTKTRDELAWSRNQLNIRERLANTQDELSEN